MSTRFESPRVAGIVLSFLMLWSLSAGAILACQSTTGVFADRVATIGIRN